jgi:alanine racemase
MIIHTLAQDCFQGGNIRCRLFAGGRQISRGNFVTLLGDGIGVDELAARAGTIGYEVLTSLGRRYRRIYFS